MQLRRGESNGRGVNESLRASALLGNYSRFSTSGIKIKSKPLVSGKLVSV